MPTPQTFTLPAGTLVERGGVAFMLKTATLIECDARDWPRIRDGGASYRPDEPDSAIGWQTPDHPGPPTGSSSAVPEHLSRSPSPHQHGLQCSPLPRASHPRICASLPPTCSASTPGPASLATPLLPSHAGPSQPRQRHSSSYQISSRHGGADMEPIVSRVAIEQAACDAADANVSPV